ncbi:MAG: hypothetical protein FJX77_08440, partial [Armatimonadetes bacterium]|nr:hypothetical protein [Armatimonadota bacterium]
RPELEGAGNGSRRRENAPTPPPPVEWDEAAGARFRRATILGDPGFGKTWLLRFDAHHRATVALAALEAGTTPPGEILLPFFHRLSSLADRPGETIAEALTTLAAGSRPTWFSEFVQQQLNSGHAVVLLDAWDEVRGQRPALFERLQQFARDFATLELRCTSRFVDYPGQVDPHGQELELLAWETPQQEGFLRAWFPPTDDRAARLLSLLREQAAIRGLARIPLMLALLCAAYERNALAFPTRRGDLYERCLQGLLRDWKEEKDKTRIPLLQVQALVRLLEGVALRLLERDVEQCGEAEWTAEIEHELTSLPGTNPLAKLGVDEVVTLLQQDGILIRDGEEREAPLRFLHRTFHEYLAGRALARRLEQEEADTWRTLPARGSDPRWSAVLPLAAGCLTDAGIARRFLEALIRAEKEEYEEVFGHRVALAAHCLPELPGNVLAEVVDLRDAITTTVFHAWWRHREASTGACVEHLGAAMRSAARSAGCVPDGVPPGRARRLPIRVEPQRVSGVSLFDCLAGLMLHWNDEVRWWAAEAMEKMGSAAATPAFLERLAGLLQHENDDVRESAVGAVGRTGSAAATPAFLERLAGLLQHESAEVRRSATEAVGGMGSAAATPAFLERLAGLLQDKDWWVRGSAAEAAGKMGSAAASPAILERLAGLLQDNDYRVRGSAAAAAGRMGSAAASPAFLERLAGLLQDNDYSVRGSAAEAVEKMGRTAATPAFLERLAGLLQHGSAEVRWRAAEAAGKVGSAAPSPAIPERLAGLLQDEDRWVRWWAAEAAGKVGSEAATPPSWSAWPGSCRTRTTGCAGVRRRRGEWAARRPLTPGGRARSGACLTRTPGCARVRRRRSR